MASDSKFTTRIVLPNPSQPSDPIGQDCLVVIYSIQSTLLGQKYPLETLPLTIGRSSQNSILLQDDSVSRNHCRIEKQGSNYVLTDMGSTNGTHINERPIQDAELRRGDQIKVGSTIFKFLSGDDVEVQYHEALHRLSITDELTSLYNKRFFLETLDREFAVAKRHLRSLSLVMFDLDCFKRTNDTYGHVAGDFVLRELATLIKDRIRASDVLCRYGGEEFGLVLPDTSRQGAFDIADLLRQRVADHTFVYQSKVIPTTISMGIAEWIPDWEASELIQKADANLYEAKRKGRNCVCC
jgi:two-component system cell cycle response regulator